MRVIRCDICGMNGPDGERWTYVGAGGTSQVCVMPTSSGVEHVCRPCLAELQKMMEALQKDFETRVTCRVLQLKHVAELERGC